MSANEMLKNEVAISLLSIYHKGAIYQTIDVMSETTIAKKFQWISIHLLMQIYQQRSRKTVFNDLSRLPERDSVMKRHIERPAGTIEKEDSLRINLTDELVQIYSGEVQRRKIDLVLCAKIIFSSIK